VPWRCRLECIVRTRKYKEKCEVEEGRQTYIIQDHPESRYCIDDKGEESLEQF
jgi:hypothetical protein